MQMWYFTLRKNELTSDHSCGCHSYNGSHGPGLQDLVLGGASKGHWCQSTVDSSPVSSLFLQVRGRDLTPWLHDLEHYKWEIKHAYQKLRNKAKSDFLTNTMLGLQMGSRQYNLTLWALLNIPFEKFFLGGNSLSNLRPSGLRSTFVK